MKRLWHEHPRLLTALLLASAITLFFVVRITMSAIYWADPAHHEEKIRPWMTVGYVAQSWDLDPFEIDTIAGLPIPGPEDKPKPLGKIAQERGVPVAEIIAKVEAAVAQLRAEKLQQ